MENYQEPDLSQLLHLAEHALNLAIHDCNTKINENTKDPFSYVLHRYDLYVEFKKIEGMEYDFLEGYEHLSFEPVTFEIFYSYLDEDVKKMLVGKIPEGAFDGL